MTQQMRMDEPPDADLLQRIEARAAEMARGAGALLARRFGMALSVEYKDKKGTDPVSAADKECQEFLRGEITRSFPDHGIVGEEDKANDERVREFTWVLDPLDGTKNFVAGLPVYASSIGVLHQGRPVAGAIFVPWPGTEKGVVVHGRKGVGTYVDGRKLGELQLDGPKTNRLSGLPPGARRRFTLGDEMKDKIGEVRSTGSVAYELALTAMAVLQYTVTVGPSVWDVAAGALLVREAGGQAAVAVRRKRLGMLRDIEWRPLDGFVAEWGSEKATNKALREWSRPMAFGSTGVVDVLTRNLRARQKWL
ncbi:MAG: inositol monophosphatase [SAR202 cluster bacterium]|nr:inositol monophosphatase [SAR202 cluster bacterium]